MPGTYSRWWWWWWERQGRKSGSTTCTTLAKIEPIRHEVGSIQIEIITPTSSLASSVLNRAGMPTGRHLPRSGVCYEWPKAKQHLKTLRPPEGFFDFFYWAHLEQS